MGEFACVDPNGVVSHWKMGDGLYVAFSCRAVRMTDG